MITNVTQSIKRRSWFLSCCLLLMVTTAWATDIQVLQDKSEDRHVAAFHHHIHNFYFNDSDKTKSNFLAMQRHANAMSYDGVTHYLASKLPANLDNLNRILLHNAYYIPLAIDFDKHEVKYTVSYQVANNRSALNAERVVWNSYPMNSQDVELIKGYACAQSNRYQSFSEKTSFSEANEMFRIDKDYKKIIVNWQSKFVVEKLAEYTIQTIKTKKYDYLFIDDLARDPGNCMNKSFGGKGSYPSWKEGQLAFLKTITEAARGLNGYQHKTVKTFVNVGSPYADVETAKWYANKTLRFDHYYFESGGFAKADLIHGQKANGVDPETGLPAFKTFGGGYIPANLTSLGTHIDTMYKVSRSKDKKLAADYRLQHYKAAGVAAAQGSWFGWYGETSVDKLDNQGALIHSNEMQLLRVIPNWDNLASISLTERHYNMTNQYYISPNSRFDSTIVQSRNPINHEVYVVFKSMQGELDLKGKEIVSATFVDDYFNQIEENATNCLHELNNKFKLTCEEHLNRGVRISTQ
jgi:hypothetical protein